MSKILKFNSLFIFSDIAKKYYFCKFNDGINIVHGDNTSGKSTLLQTILYIFGVNDVKKYLDNIYSSDYILRLNCTISENNKDTSITIIRNNGSIYIKVEDKPIESFDGINASQSLEHGRFKEYIRELFDFSLMLLSNGKYTEASIETLFLPYYISQNVGWVSVRKTFSGLEYYRNFKNDYLDYYLRISSSSDIEKKIALETEKNELNIKKNILENTIENSPEIVLSILEDDSMKKKCTEYIINFSTYEKELKELHRKYIDLCNKIELLKIRKKILSGIKANQNEQNPIKQGCCPTCKQALILTLETAYVYLQKYEDTESELNYIANSIITKTTKLDSTHKKIEKLSSIIEEHRKILDQYNERDTTMKQWLDNQIEQRILNHLTEKKIDILKELDRVDNDLKYLITDDEIDIKRAKFDREFKGYFTSYLRELKVLILDDERFNVLYKISVLPYQGVELLKAMIAYHFAFNKTIIPCGRHRFPFLLDAIFKEDIVYSNKMQILNFIKNNAPTDTQLIFSMADKRKGDDQINASDVNRDIFNNSAHLILTSDNPRSMLKDWDDIYKKMRDETIQFIY